jgi:hypothetical protein
VIVWQSSIISDGCIMVCFAWGTSDDAKVFDRDGNEVPVGHRVPLEVLRQRVANSEEAAHRGE